MKDRWVQILDCITNVSITYLYTPHSTLYRLSYVKFYRIDIMETGKLKSDTAYINFSVTVRIINRMIFVFNKKKRLKLLGIVAWKYSIEIKKQICSFYMFDFNVYLLESYSWWYE